MKLVLSIVLLGLSAASTLLALDPPRPAILERAGFEQKLGTQLPLDLSFRDETGATVKLADMLQGKPTILTLVYFECPMLCNMVLNGVVKSLKELSFEVGDEFNVITLSFDPSETPELAAQKKQNYLKEYGKPGAEKGWHFLTGDETTIQQIAQGVGFKYAYDEKQGEFAHASGIMVLTPEGKLSHYFYGVEYPAKDLRLGLVEASSGKIGSPVDQLLLFCYHYDPITGKYSAAIMKVMQAGCFLTVFAIAAYLIVMFRREAKRPAQPIHEKQLNIGTNGF